MSPANKTPPSQEVDAPQELDWSHLTTDVPAKGLEITREATPEERAKCAAELKLQALDKLAVRYRITAIAGHRYRLRGELRAQAVQSCVVTLDPVPARITEPLDAEFRAPDDVPEIEETEQGALEAVEHEVILNQQLHAGRVVFETLAAALPVFPRAPDASLEQTEASPASGASTSPFSDLAKWKPEKG